MALTNLSQITTSGIATGTDLNIRNITGAAATFTGNVTVGGTLTYEDVTNIDSVGLITARSGINVNSGDVNITSGNLALASATPMVVASNGSGSLRLGAGGSEKVRITSAGNVGIGITIPGSLLHISGENAIDARIKIEDNDNGFAASEIGVENGGRDLKIAAPQDIYFEDVDTGVRHLYIESGGNIGIGTDNPDMTLHLYDSTAFAAFTNNGDTGESGILFRRHDNNHNRGKVTYNFTDDALIFRASNNGGGEDLRITSSGNIGIGTDTPAANIDVQKSGTGTIARFGVGDGTTNLDIKYSSNTTTFDQQNNKSIAFETANTERLRITSAGKVGIGTDDPDSLLHLADTNTTVWPFANTVSGTYAYSPYPHELKIQNNARDVTGAFAGIYFNSGASPDGSYKSSARIAAIDTGNYRSDLAFGTRNTNFKERLRIRYDGNIGIGTDNPTDHLQIHHTNAKGLTFKTTESHYAQITADSNRSSADNHLLAIEGHWNGTPVAEIAFKTGDDTTNKDNGEIIFRTAPASNLASNERLRITSAGRVGIGTDVPTSDLHVFRSTATSSIIDAAAGNALLTLRNAGNTNWSGINFTRERNTGTNVTGGSIWMPSDTSNNSATLYLQTQSASANAGAAGALTDNNGVRLKLASQPGGNGDNSAFTVEVGSTEKFRVHADGESKFTVGTNKFVKFYAATHDDEADLGAGLAFSRPSDGADMLSGMFSHSNTGLGIAARDHVTILTGGTSTVSNTEERVRITSNGAVGIGTNSPDDRLHVLGGNIQIGKIEEAGYETILGNNNLSFNRSAASYINQKGAGDIRFRYGANDTTWMHMEGSSGHIGIGTDNVDHRLEVFGPPGPGDLSIKSAASAAGGTEHSKLRFRVRNPANQESTLASIHVISDSNWGGNLTFGTKTASGGLSESTVERVRIKHNGMVGIGTQAYGNIDPLAPLHVSSYAPTTTITDHQHLRNAAQILCQTSNNVNNSKSGIMFSGALHSTDGCSAGIIANHENVAENSETTSLSFYTSYQEVIGERFRIFADGQFDMNGVRNIFETFRLTNNVAYEFDYTVPDEGGYGNSFRIEAGYNHYYAATYGAHRSAWVSTRGTNLAVMVDQNQNTSQAGGWSFSKPNSTTLRVTKSAGSYGGSGYGFLHIRYNHF